MAAIKRTPGQPQNGVVKGVTLITKKVGVWVFTAPTIMVVESGE